MKKLLVAVVLLTPSVCCLSARADHFDPGAPTYDPPSLTLEEHTDDYDVEASSSTTAGLTGIATFVAIMANNGGQGTAKSSTGLLTKRRTWTWVPAPGNPNGDPAPIWYAKGTADGIYTFNTMNADDAEQKAEFALAVSANASGITSDDKRFFYNARGFWPAHTLYLLTGTTNQPAANIVNVVTTISVISSVLSLQATNPGAGRATSGTNHLDLPDDEVVPVAVPIIVGDGPADD